MDLHLKENNSFSIKNRMVTSSLVTFGTIIVNVNKEKRPQYALIGKLLRK